MSEHENEQLERLNALMNWMLGGIGVLLVGAMGVGAWVARQESHITRLNETAQAASVERGEMRGSIKTHGEIITTISRDTAVQNRDISYIRETVMEIKQELKGNSH
jgi:hypothetical protein